MVAFPLASSASLDDLRTYLQRAQRVEDGSLRIMSSPGTLAVYTAILYPRGLLDTSPTVLGLRIIELDGGDEVDAVVPLRSTLHRIDLAAETVPAADNAPCELTLPHEVSTVTWAGISPPRDGWRPLGSLAPQLFEQAAHAGIEEVAEMIPEGTGEQLVQRARAEVWSRGIEGVEYIPAGAAFAALSLGFLGSDDIDLYETGPWTRLSTARGHVLVRQKPWALRG